MYKSHDKLKRAFMGINRVFQLKEAYTIVDCIQDYTNDELSAKDFLVFTLEVNIVLSHIGKKWAIDKVTLLNKINSMSEAQCSEIVKMADEFWNAMEDGYQSEDLIKEIFLVS